MPARLAALGKGGYLGHIKFGYIATWSSAVLQPVGLGARQKNQHRGSIHILSSGRHHFTIVQINSGPLARFLNLGENEVTIHYPALLGNRHVFLRQEMAPAVQTILQPQIKVEIKHENKYKYQFMEDTTLVDGTFIFHGIQIFE